MTFRYLDYEASRQLPNIVVDGSARVTRAFNAYFDLFWANSDAREYSLAYDVFKDKTAPDWKWRKGEKPYYWSTF